MKALKGIIVYIGLVLMAIILIFGLMVGFLFLSKKSTIFGYYFRNVSLKESTHYEKPLYTDEADPTNSKLEVVNLKIKANNYNVLVKPHQESMKLVVSSLSDYFGFLKASVDPETKEKSAVECPTALVTKQAWSVDKTTFTLEINMLEPEGLFGFRKNNTLYIDVPFQVGNHVVKYNLDITTGNKDITFKAGTLVTKTAGVEKTQTLPLNIDSMVLNTNKGDAIISGIGSTIDKLDKETTVDKLDISTNGGTFDFSAYDVITVKTNKLSLTSKNANYKFKKLVAEEGIEVVGNNVKLDADEIHCGKRGFLYKADTGALRIGILNSSNMVRITDGETYNYKLPVDESLKLVYENSIFTKSSDIEINEVVGKVGLVNTYGNVNIGHLSHQASITSENGNVKIGTSGYLPSSNTETKNFTDTSSLIVFTTYGDINVGEYYQDGVFYSKKGSITVKSLVGKTGIKGKQVGGVWEDGSRYFYTDITSKDGKITATTDGNPVRIVCTGDANVKLKFTKLLDTIDYGTEKKSGLLPGVFAENIPYYVSTNKGKIEATLPIQSYKIHIKGKTISGEIGATNSFSEEGTQINPVVENQPEVSIFGKKIFLASNI